MKAYILRIIMTVSGAHLLLTSLNVCGGENTRKMIRYLCNIILLLTLFSPIGNFAEGIVRGLDRLFTDEIQETVSLENYQNSVRMSTHAYSAESILTHISETYGIEKKNIRLTFITDENDSVTEIEIILRNCGYTVREKIQKDFGESMNILVSVKGDDGYYA